MVTSRERAISNGKKSYFNLILQAERIELYSHSLRSLSRRAGYQGVSVVAAIKTAADEIVCVMLITTVAIAEGNAAAKEIEARHICRLDAVPDASASSTNLQKRPISRAAIYRHSHTRPSDSAKTSIAACVLLRSHSFFMPYQRL